MTPDNKTIYSIQMDKTQRDEWKAFSDEHGITVATMVQMSVAYIMEEATAGRMTIGKTGIRETKK